MKRSVGPYAFTLDVEATRAAYSAIEAGGSRLCECEDCKNYVQAYSEGKVFASEALAFFDQLGIDPAKDIEVWAIVDDDAPEGPRCYHGSFHVAGRLLRGFDERTSVEVSNTTICVQQNARQAEPPFKGKAHVEIHYSVVVPWVLPHKYGDATPEKWKQIAAEMGTPIDLNNPADRRMLAIASKAADDGIRYAQRRFRINAVLRFLRIPWRWL